ncbi:MAG: hypothetical protein QF707_01575 [Candidatus Poseidoniaceae archaeon]|nr:hypothetical protein [Candidatus Poseidoniaceae archaeon]
MRISAICTLIVLLLSSGADALIQVVMETEGASGRAGVDVYVSDIDISYTNSADENKYRMFSSNYPISGFNRPENLFVVDGVLNVDMTISITASNSGTSDSSTFNAEVVIFHDEYTEFEIHNTSFTFPNVPASGSSSTSFTWTPTYSGNHSIEIRLQNLNDDVYSNNINSRHMTVAYHYDNCDDLTQWSQGTGWSSNTDAYISTGTACHVGNGQSSTYGSSWSTSLDMPIMNLADLATNPTRVIGLSFFYTGSIQSGDLLSIQARISNGSWEQLATLTGTIDADFLDGSTNWQTFSNSAGSQVTPIIPMQARHFHSSSQLRFAFSSDSSGEDIGYWLDDLVILYDQKPRVDEFEWTIDSISDSQARRGEWSDHTVQISNHGNLSDRFLPEITGISSEWEVAFNHETGSNIDINNGVRVSPGDSKNIRIRMKPGPNASTGNQTFTLKINSLEQGTVSDQMNAVIRVLPDHVPLILEQTDMPTCFAGYSCEFFVDVDNIGDSSDIFDITVSPFDIREGWSLGLAWDQDSSITIAPGVPETVKFIVSVPDDEVPDVYSSVTLEVTSRSDSSRSDTMQISAAAAMVSDAEFSIQDIHTPPTGWVIDPGGSVEVRFTLWNNASRQDTFSFDIEIQGSKTWSVDVPEYPDLPINSGSSTVYTVTVNAPESAQAGDPGPVLIPSATSTRSGMNITGLQFNLLEVSAIHDIIIREVDMPSLITPGKATVYTVEIENDGNGAVDVIMELPDLPQTWEWWTIVDGVNISGPIRLTPSYDLQDIAVIGINILAPANEVAGETLEFTISISPLEGDDISPGDNLLTHEIITAQVKRPEMTPPTSSELLMDTSGEVDFYFTVTNVGNIRDDLLKVKATFTSAPAGADVSVIVERIGGEVSLGSEWLTGTLMDGASADFIVTLKAESDLVLNTEIIVKLIVIGGLDENSQPYQIEHEVSIIADSRRDVTVNLISETLDSILGDGEQHSFALEFNSASSIDEYVSITFINGGKMECNGLEVGNEYNLTLVKPPSLATTFYSLECVIERGASGVDNEISIKVSIDDEIVLERSAAASWKEADQASEDLFSTLGEESIYAGGAGIVLLIVISLMFMSRRQEETEDEMGSQYPSAVEYGQSAQVENSYPQEVAVYGQGTDQVQLQPTSNYQPLPSGPPASTVQQPVVAQQSLASASQLLVPSTTSVVEDKTYSDGFSNSQLLASGWTQPQIDERYAYSAIEMAVETTAPLANAFDTLVTSPIAEEVTTEDAAPTNPEMAQDAGVEDGVSMNTSENNTLPSVNCIISGVALTANHQWSQCPECGGWADAKAKATVSNCPRCRASW